MHSLLAVEPGTPPLKQHASPDGRRLICATGKNGRPIVEEMQPNAGLCIQINDIPYSNDMAFHRTLNGSLLVTTWHMQAMLQTLTSRTAKIITGIGYDVKDDHQMLQELENGYVTHKLIDYVQLKRPTC